MSKSAHVLVLMRMRSQRKKDLKTNPKSKGKKMRKVRRKRRNQRKNLTKRKERKKLNQKGRMQQKWVLHQLLILRMMEKNKKVTRYNFAFLIRLL